MTNCLPSARGATVLVLLLIATQQSCGPNDSSSPSRSGEPSEEAPGGGPDDGDAPAASGKDASAPPRDAATERADARSGTGTPTGGANADAQAGSPRDGMAGSLPDASASDAAPSPETRDGGASLTSILPPIDDPAEPGPFGFEQVATAPGLTSHTLFVPKMLGNQGVKHPIIVWTNGATGSTNFYQNMLQHFASHGFFVVADKMSGGNHDPEIVSQKAGIDWAIAEAKRPESPYFGKIDPDRLGIAGHSLGSVASFANTGHPAVKASVHWSGHLTGNPVGADESWLQLLHAPAAFFCGGDEPRALPRCSGDFDNAPKSVPLFYGTVQGVGHTDVFGESNGGQWGRAAVAFWRLTLGADESFRKWFSGADCVLCKAPWTGKSRGI